MAPLEWWCKEKSRHLCQESNLTCPVNIHSYFKVWSKTWSKVVQFKPK